MPFYRYNRAAGRLELFYEQYPNTAEDALLRNGWTWDTAAGCWINIICDETIEFASEQEKSTGENNRNLGSHYEEKGNRIMPKKNIYSKGEVLLIAADTEHPVAEGIQKLRNAFFNANITRAIYHSKAKNGMCYVIPCLEKKTRRSIPIRVSGRPMFAPLSAPLLIDEDALTLYPGLRLDDRKETMERIERGINPSFPQKENATDLELGMDAIINDRRLVLTPMNLSLIGALDDFLSAYNTIKEDCCLFVFSQLPLTWQHTQMTIPGIPIHDLIARLNPLLNRYLWFLTANQDEITLQAKHFKYFSCFDSSKNQSFEFQLELIRDLKKRNPNVILSQNDLLYAENDGFNHFRISQTFVSFNLFMENVEIAFRKAILENVQEKHPDKSLFQNRDEIFFRASRIVEQKKKEYLLPNPRNDLETKGTLFLYDLLLNTACYRQKHQVIPRIYYAKAETQGGIVALPAHYCSDCNKFFMGQLSYSMFSKCFGGFKVQTERERSSGLCFDNFQAESKLHKLGYTVKAGILSEEERQSLLVSAYEGKKLTFFDICSTIERDIAIFENNEHFENAVEKWKNDLKFINEYVSKQVNRK